VTALALNPAYSLRRFRAPTVVRSEEQNAHYTAVLAELDRKKRLTSEEEKLAELLTLLITEYEEKQFRLPKATPLEVLRELMRANNLRQKDLLGVFGTESIASEVLNGKRELNKEHIRRLSKRFRVSPALFF
jgi:HTH-type transcriptional regulator/antitoxin HigA